MLDTAAKSPKPMTADTPPTTRKRRLGLMPDWYSKQVALA